MPTKGRDDEQRGHHREATSMPRRIAAHAPERLHRRVAIAMLTLLPNRPAGLISSTITMMTKTR